MTLEDTARNLFAELPPSIQGRVLRRMGRRADWSDGRRPTPPPCPPGMTTGAPDFVGIGFSKAGTTWWFSLILAHPDVHGPLRKELQYFNRFYLARARTQGVDEDDVRAYHDWFPRPAGTVTGEWTPSYVVHYQLPEILYRAAPKAKLLTLLRDPVERYQSDISRRMARQRRQNVRLRSFPHGEYAQKLRPWEDRFGADAMLVLQYEACVAQPAEQLARTYRFLGLDDGFRPARLLDPVNKTKTKQPVDERFRRMLTELYEGEVVAVTARYPDLDLSLWPNFAYLVR
ncbi:MAG: sulfotransferase [Acidimicrobiales bacterium]|nr:sulfotransferase [Acidimicrobiales bacterium]